MDSKTDQQNPAESTSPENRVKMTMVFIGRVKTKQDHRAWLYHDVDMDNNNGDNLSMTYESSRTYLKKNILGSITPGSIIEIMGTTDKKTVFPNTAKIVGLWKNDDDVKLWTANHRAVEMDIEVNQRAIKEIKKKLPLNSLEGFRRAYQNALNCRRKAHILSMVIEAITSEKPLKGGTDDVY
jgi:hypothetical protein